MQINTNKTCLTGITSTPSYSAAASWVYQHTPNFSFVVCNNVRVQFGSKSKLYGGETNLCSTSNTRSRPFSYQWPKKQFLMLGYSPHWPSATSCYFLLLTSRFTQSWFLFLLVVGLRGQNHPDQNILLLTLFQFEKKETRTKPWKLLTLNKLLMWKDVLVTWTPLLETIKTCWKGLCSSACSSAWFLLQ